MAPRQWRRSPVSRECLLSLLSEKLWISGIASSLAKARAFPLPCNQLFFPGLQTLAAVVPGISQVDNNSDFLGKTPHRRHPGILQLPCIKVPPALAAAAQFLLLGEYRWEAETREANTVSALSDAFHLWPIESSMPNVEKQVQALTNYLWSRRLPVEPQELQRRAVHLEKKFLENPGGA